MSQPNSHHNRIPRKSIPALFSTHCCKPALLVSGKTITLHVRNADFYSSWGKQDTLRNYINQSDDIYKAAIRILDTVELQQPVWQLGVRFSNLQFHSQQLSLFWKEQKKCDMVRAMDIVNDKFGDFTVTFGSLLSTEEKGSLVISPAWRPDGIRSVDVNEESNRAWYKK
jgi:DNA polymerase-4